LSAFTFGEDFRARADEWGTVSTAGFDGPCWAPWIWLDLDRSGNIDLALKEARRLAMFLDERFALRSEDDLLAFLSGNKGFHLGAPTSLWCPEPAVDFHRVARRFACRLAELAEVGVYDERRGYRIDEGVYVKVQLFRAPNSRHPKGGRHKRRLLFSELMELSVERILHLAERPEPFDIPTSDYRSEQAARDWADAVRAVAQEAEVRQRRRLEGAGKPTLNRLTREFICKGASEGARHRLLFSAGTVSTLVSGLNNPTGVAVDGAGNVYIADSFNGAVREWNASTRTVSTLVSSGLSLPYGLAVEGAGNVFIADSGNAAVKELPRAFVPGGALTEGPAAGSDALQPVLPTTQALTGVFAPSSDQSWLTLDGVANGVVHFTFTANPGDAPRTAHLTVLGQQATVTQEGVASATHFQVTPSAQSVVAGTPLSLTVTAEDAAGNPAAYLGTVHFTSTDPLASLPPDYTFTAADNGVHTFTDVILHAAGSPTVTATDTATGSITGSATVTVDKATPTITWDNPADITYGTPLGPTQLDATADVPGTFTYTPAAGTVLGAGANQVLTVLFTPSDPTAFSAPSFTKQVTITVDPAPLTVSADATRWYGRPDSTATVTGHYTGLVNGDTGATIGGPPGFTDSATLSSPPGTYSLTPAGLSTYSLTTSIPSAPRTPTRPRSTGGMARPRRARWSTRGRCSRPTTTTSSTAAATPTRPRAPTPSP
jgi:hypothetical protein